MRLTEEETRVLTDALDMVLQGMSDARNEMIEDAFTFKTVDEYMETLGQQEADIETIRNIKKKVAHEGERRQRGFASAVRALRAYVQGHAG